WVLSMARADGDRNSATSSFSILLGKAPHLDGEYTIFGRVTGGFDVVEELTRVPRTPDNRPSVRLTIRRARVLEARELATASLAPAQSVHRACEAPAPVHAPAMLLMV